jgi:iron complex outermembrane recepter protein
MVTNSVRRNLLASTIIAGALIASPAFAQDAKPADAPAAEGETIIVTGSLIKNPNLAQSSPVIVTSSEEIALRQNNVAEEVLRDIPGIVPNIGSAVNNGNGGASYVDLRGLGSFRNIVLLDGNRIVPSGLLGRVDLNNIPLALVDRVDALTGGASTTYGADAVSGVVNFITKRDFSGVEISVGEKITQKGDGNYLRTDVTIGGNFDDGRGNAVLSVGYQESDPVYQGDRDFSVQFIDSYTGTFGGSGTTVPSRVGGTRGLTGGVPNTNPATGNGGTRQIDPTTGSAIGSFKFFNFNPYNIFQTPFRRYNMYGAARYEVSDAVELYTRGMFSKNTVNTIIAPSGSFGSAVQINLNNPFLPTTLRNQYCAFDIDPRAAFYQPRFTPAQCAAGAASAGPGTAGYNVIGAGNVQPNSVLLGGAYDSNGDGVVDARDTVDLNPATTLSRRLVEGGPRVSEFSTTIFDYRVGARGAINEHINWDVTGAYGESENRQTLQGYVVTSRLRQALLANNATTCITATNGCVPINVFGDAGTISAAAAKFIQQESTTLTKTSLAQVRGLVSGDFGAAIPSASDPINFAVGAEYRKYSASQRADSLAKIPGELGGAGGAAPDVDGAYSVYEFYGELVVPLVQDKPFFEDLTAKGGIRYSSYKVDAAGKPSYNTTTYKGELAWSPVKDIKFRGGYSRAVRAPNINELFAPVLTGLTTLATDPCVAARPQVVGETAAATNLRNVCLAQGAPASSIGSILNPTASQANVTGGGNPNIKPETSDSYTFGAVLTPSFVPGLSLTVDYYHIRIKNAITTQTSGDILASCFGTITAASATSPACTNIRRNPSSGGLDGDPATTLGLPQPLTNLGKLQTSGIDVALNYKRDLGFAKLALSFSGNYTFESKFQAIAQTTPAFPLLSIDRECVGFYSPNCGSLQPKFQWSQRTTLSFGDVDFSVLWRHIDKMRQEPDDVINGRGEAFHGTLADGRVVDFRRIKAFDYFDATARFGITSKIDLTMGVTNVFNVKPPIVGGNIGPTSYNSGSTYPSTYDSLGRTFAVSAKVHF